MKQLFIALSLFCLCLCSCSKSANQGSKNESENWSQYSALMKKAVKSPTTEKKLFGDFEIGMSEAQVDSIIKAMYENDDLIYFLDVNQDSAPIRMDDSYDINTSAFIFRHEKTPFYIEFTPNYLSGRLVGLFCILKPDKDHKYDEPPYKIMADIFQASERGKGFTKIEMSGWNKEKPEEVVYSFVKDNLEVLFFPQPSGDGTMSYRNIPDMEALAAEERKNNDSSKEL